MILAIKVVKLVSCNGLMWVCSTKIRHGALFHLHFLPLCAQAAGGIEASGCGRRGRPGRRIPAAARGFQLMPFNLNLIKLG